MFETLSAKSRNVRPPDVCQILLHGNEGPGAVADKYGEREQSNPQQPANKGLQFEVKFARLYKKMSE